MWRLTWGRAARSGHAGSPSERGRGSKRRAARRAPRHTFAIAAISCLLAAAASLAARAASASVSVAASASASWLLSLVAMRSFGLCGKVEGCNCAKGMGLGRRARASRWSLRPPKASQSAVFVCGGVLQQASWDARHCGGTAASAGAGPGARKRRSRARRDGAGRQAHLQQRQRVALEL
jgi:hypothetical protein